MQYTKLKIQKFHNINIPAKEVFLIKNNMDRLLESIDNGENCLSEFFYILEDLIDTCFLSKCVYIRLIGSQLAIIAQVLYHMPYKKLFNSLLISKKFIYILKEKLLKNSMVDSYYNISTWFNRLIQDLPLEEIYITRMQISDGFKRKGSLIKNEPKKVGELYQLFVLYSNKKLKSESGLQEMPFLLKYIQQIFKEISYDEGHLFDEASYDNFSVIFGKICFLIGEAIEENNKEKIFSIITSLYGYSENLRGDLYKDKITRN